MPNANERTTISYFTAVAGALLASLLWTSLVFGQEAKSERKLTFPTDQIVGVLRVGPVLYKEQPKDGPAPFHLPAHKTVSIDSQEQVELAVAPTVSLEFLSQLPTDALQAIELRDRSLTAADFLLLSRFTDLQSLELSRCEIETSVWNTAEGFSALRDFSITSSDDSTVSDASFAKWIRRCTSLADFYSTPGMKAPAIKILSGHPTLTSMSVKVTKDREAIVFPLLRGIPKLSRLVVSVDEDVSPRALDRVASLKGLSSITIVRANVDGELLKQIASVGSVKELRLIVVTVGDGFLDGLVENQNLEILLLNTMPMDDDAAFRRSLADTLLQMPSLKSLPKIRNPDEATLNKILARGGIEELRIDGLSRGTDRQRLLDGLAKLPKLRVLELSSIPITDDEMRFLQPLTQLRELSLVHTAVQGPGWRHVSGLPFLRRVQIMMNAKRTEPDLASLALLPHLRRLQIFGLRFAPEHFFPVAKCEHLEHIALSEGKIDDAVAARIARLPRLKRLALWDTEMTQRGAEEFLKTETLSSINIAGHIPAVTIRRLALLPNLTNLHVTSTGVQQEEAEMLEAELKGVANISIRPKK